jgi:hypothetical protein
MALRFITYCMTIDAQALWQFQLDDDADDNLGPDTFELRRMPVRREMYAIYMERMVDKVNPYETARPAPYPDRNMRAFIGPIFSAMAMNNHEELMHAWEAIFTHPAYPRTTGIVTALDVQDAELMEMLLAFDAMPLIPTNTGGELSMDTPEVRKILKYGWLRNQWVDDGLWHPEDYGSAALKRQTAEFYNQQYKTVVELRTP